VLIIFSYAFTSYRELLLHCTSALQSTRNKFLKIDASQDYLLRFTSKSFLSFLNGRGSWRNPVEEKRLMRNERITFAALEQRKLALSSAA